MSETTVEAPASSNGSRGRQAAVTVVESGGAGPEAKTPIGTAPIIPLMMIGVGAYLIWFMVHYWRQTGAAVWPSAPIKSVLQGKGIQLTAATKAPPTSATVTAYEQSLGGAIAQQEQFATPTTGGGGGGGGGSPGPSPPPGASETLIIRAVLGRIGAPQTSQNINSMAAWIRHEQAGWPPAAKFNPMNTTLPMPGSTCFNSVCVRNYTSWAQGIEATAQTLLGGYSCIVARFRSGAGVCGTGCASDFLRWSGNGYSSVC